MSLNQSVDFPTLCHESKHSRPFIHVMSDSNIREIPFQALSFSFVFALVPVIICIPQSDLFNESRFHALFVFVFVFVNVSRISLMIANDCLLNTHQVLLSAVSQSVSQSDI